MAHALLSRSPSTNSAPGTGRARKLLLLFSLLGALVVPVSATARADEGDDQYRFLVGLIDKGLYEKAVTEAESFLRDHPRHERAQLARYRLATAYFELERWDDAAPSFQSLAGSRGFEYRAESAFRLGQCLLSRDRLPEAAAAFEIVRGLGQEYLHGPALFFLAETSFRGERVDEAEGQYRKLLANHPQSEHVPAARRGLTWCAWERRDVEATRKRARTYLEHHADAEQADEVRILLGEALLEGEQPGAALKVFEAVRSPAFGDARQRGAGFAHAALGDPGAAARAFAGLLEQYPESRFSAEARLQLGIQTLRAGDARAAARTLRRAAEDGDAEAAYWLAQAQDAGGDPERALRTLDQALKRRPGSELEARIQVARGDLLNRLGRSEAALAAYESGGSEYALYAAAVAGLNRGDGANAIRLVEKLFEAHPTTQYRDEAELVLGEAHFAQADHARAERIFQGLLERELAPEHAARAQGRLGWCRYLQGDLAGAGDSFERLVRRHGQEAEAEEGLYMLGRLRLEAGDTGGAEQAHTEYLRRYPAGRWRAEVLFASARSGDGGGRELEALLAEHAESPLIPRALLELGDRAAAEGRFEEALAHYRAILQDHPQSDVAPQAAYGLAWCLYRDGEYGTSARVLEELAGAGATDAELRVAALELCIWAHCKNGDPAAATTAWQSFGQACGDEGRVFEGARTVVAAWRDAGDPRRGQAVLDQLLRNLDDESLAVGVLLEGAYLALEEGDVDRADAQIQVAARRAGDGSQVAEASFFVGEARFANGDDERAILLYRAAAADGSPVQADALYKLGFAQLRSGELAEAEASFRAVVDGHRASELWGESLFLLGETRYQRGRFAEAAEALALLVNEAPEHEVAPKALFRLGLALGQLERWEACEAALARLARSQPEFPNLAEAELWRGKALAARRKVRAARQAFERVTTMDRGELAAQARLGLGGLLEQEGRVDDALSEYLRVAVLYGHDALVAEALLRAGACLETLGSPEKALEQYQEIVAEHPESPSAAAARERIQALRTQ